MYFAIELCMGKAGELLLWSCSCASRKKSSSWSFFGLFFFFGLSYCWMEGCTAATLLYCCSGLALLATGKAHHFSCTTISCAGKAFMCRALGENCEGPRLQSCQPRCVTTVCLHGLGWGQAKPPGQSCCRCSRPRELRRLLPVAAARAAAAIALSL